MVTTLKVHSIGSAIFVCACALMGIGANCQAGSAEEPFYHQFIDLKARTDYQPTRTFTIVTDTEHGNRLVAEDDPDLRFNIMWMDQFQPGYKTRRGGAAFGQLFRSYVRSLYQSYRNNQISNSLTPGAAQQGDRSDKADTDYDLRISEDEVKIGIKYSY